MLVGSCFRSTPQILRIIKADSAAGVSLFASIAELVAYSITCAYNMRLGAVTQSKHSPLVKAAPGLCHAVRQHHLRLQHARCGSSVFVNPAPDCGAACELSAGAGRFRHHLRLQHASTPFRGLSIIFTL